MKKRSPHLKRPNRTARNRKRKGWSLRGDATANLKAWSRNLTVDDVIEMCKEPLDFEIKMRSPSELRKRKAG